MYRIGDAHYNHVMCQNLTANKIYTRGDTPSEFTSLIITDTSPSFNSNEGSLIVKGGVGISGDLNVNSDIVANDGITIMGTSNSSSCTSGALVVAGGVGICKDLFIDGIITVNNPTESTTPSNGSLVVRGGVGISGDLNVAGSINANFTHSVSNISSNTTLSSEYIINVVSTFDITLDLPPVSSNSGKTYIIIKETSNNIMINAAGSDNIFNGIDNNAINMTGIIGERVMLLSNGLKWYIM